MILYINTANSETIELQVKSEEKIVSKSKFLAKFRQSEKLLPEIEKLLEKNKTDLKGIKEVLIENKGESFTALRIGVIVANALGFALGIPVRAVGTKVSKAHEKKFSVVKPMYNREPNITMKKK